MSKLELGESEVLKNLLEEKELLEKQNKILKEALEFYADQDNWWWQEGDSSKVQNVIDHSDVNYNDPDFIAGKKARQALKKCEEMQ